MFKFIKRIIKSEKKETKPVDIIGRFRDRPNAYVRTRHYCNAEYNGKPVSFIEIFNGEKTIFSGSFSELEHKLCK